MINKKGFMCLLLLLSLVSLGAYPRFTGGGGFSANAVLWFYGTEVAAQFTGEMTLSGSVDLDGESVLFNAKGGLHGDAEGDSSTLTGVGWGIFTASGSTSSGGEIKLYGGLTADTSDVSISSDTSGTGTATFFALIVIDGRRFEAVGTANASASGDLVTPEDPYTMELAGRGSISFYASSMVPLEDRSVSVSDLPWSLNGWPQALKSELLSLLGAKEEEEVEQEEPLDVPEWDEQGI